MKDIRSEEYSLNSSVRDLPWPDYLAPMMQAHVALCLGCVYGTKNKPKPIWCKRPYLVGINERCDSCGNDLRKTK